ncbi:MAG TPA: PKD domain-containing protein, partial [Mycobacteriales bacterium]|nr:PKD domain-containing protein [Mycobacteriales bacterium]
GVFSRQSCAEAKHGSIEIGVERRRGTVGAPRLSTEAAHIEAQIDVAVQAAFCRDARARAAAGAAAAQEVLLLCHGFIPLPIPAAPSRDQILHAFRELPLYRGEIRTDPAVLTLVNLETYFWCGDAAGRDCRGIGEGEQRVTLLGQQVRVRPRILSYAWDFGDGTGQQLTDGKAAHAYRHAGDYTVTVTLTWTADYALGSGAFRPIGDSTTTTSPPRVLPVREAQTVIVGES